MLLEFRKYVNDLGDITKNLAGPNQSKPVFLKRPSHYHYQSFHLPLGADVQFSPKSVVYWNIIHYKNGVGAVLLYSAISLEVVYIVYEVWCTVYMK